MAKGKKAKKAKKAEKAKKAKKQTKIMETQATETAHKIWLAGVGAYGKLYDAAIEGAGQLNEQSAELFDELVKRGEGIENDVRARLKGDDRIVQAGKQVSKALGTARDFQEDAREQFETRMDRMRQVLGVKNLGSNSDKLSKQLDKLEDKVVDLTNKAKEKSGDATLRKRLARLTAEIEAVAQEAGADLMKAAKHTRDAVAHAVTDEAEVKTPTGKRVPTGKAKVRPAKKSTAKKTAARKSMVKRVSKAPRAAAKMASTRVKDDLTMITGVGPALVKRLAAEGITTYAQIAALKKNEAMTLDEKITARGRIIRDSWVRQAKALMK